jgi:hypothetical protein
MNRHHELHPALLLTILYAPGKGIGVTGMRYGQPSAEVFSTLRSRRGKGRASSAELSGKFVQLVNSVPASLSYIIRILQPI